MSDTDPALALDDHPLVTEGMRRSLGVWDEWGRWSAPIRDSDIRRWALAVYWPEAPPRRFWDQAFANETSEGGLVAPEEFNPFAWPEPRSAESTKSSSADRQPCPSEVRRRVNGGCRATYGARMRPGDRIRRRVRLEGWRTTEGSNGPLLFIDYEHEWRNQADELVRSAIYTLIYW
jgi:hypothetical protein